MIAAARSDLEGAGLAAASAAEADAAAFLDRQARNAALVAASEAASPDDRERARITRQCAERWAQDLRAGMHHGEADAWAEVLARIAAETRSEGETV